MDNEMIMKAAMAGAGSQVKFYHYGTKDRFLTKMNEPGFDATGIYFIDDTHEIYRGSVKYSGTNVYHFADIDERDSSDTTFTVGDIAICEVGGSYIYSENTLDGSDEPYAWCSIGPDIAELASQWTSDIESAASELRSEIAELKEDIDSTISDLESTLEAEINDVEDRVDALESSLSNLDATVSDTDNGVTVEVQQENGPITEVKVTAPKIVQTIGDIETAAANKIVSEKALAEKFATLENAVHFRGVFKDYDKVENPEAGDIIIIGGNPITGSADSTTSELDSTAHCCFNGEEYVFDGAKWEVIGDQDWMKNLTTWLNEINGRVEELESWRSDLDFDGTSNQDESNKNIVPDSTDSSLRVRVIQEDGKITNIYATLTWIED